eukprot:g1810.t1
MNSSISILCLVVVLVLAFQDVVSAKKSSDPKACEVCVAMLDKVLTKLDNPKKDRRNQAKVSKAIDSACSKKEKNNSKERKLCYFIDPVKKLVFDQLKIGKPMKKVCETLAKQNPQFCEIKYKVKTNVNTDYSKMRVKQLKQVLRERGVMCRGCLEKRDFVKRCEETAHLDDEL